MSDTDYAADIRSWDWAAIKRDALQSLSWERYEPDQLIGQSFLGTVFALMPSGKVYAPWSSNVTEEEANQDEAFTEALEAIAEEHGMFITSGENDPCDIFAAIAIDADGFDDTVHGFVEHSNRDEWTDYVTERAARREVES